jgi:hypothetical protein
LRPVAAKEAACDRCRIARIDDRRPPNRRPRKPTGKIADAPRPSGAYLDEIERKAAKFRVLLVEHLKSIDDGANRANHIMTDAGAKKRGEVEGSRANTVMIYPFSAKPFAERPCYVLQNCFN